MQTLISQLAFSFVDDALVLATGFGRLTVEFATGALAAARNAVMAPLDRLARACDVAGTLAIREQAKRRPASRAARPSDSIAMLATFRTLRDLS